MSESSAPSEVVVRFSAGTLELVGLHPDAAALVPDCRWDERTACHRGPAAGYAPILRALRRADIPFRDQARAYDTLDAGLRAHREPRDYQREALDAWQAQRGRGVVVLPTGAGKSLVALMAIHARARAALVVAPTLDLVRQWYDLLRASFAVPVGVIGGGEYELAPLTVTTYDSAYNHMENLGNRFGLVVFDECHHLPSESYALAARLCLAPFRLGLTATPERADGREAALAELIGPLAYRRDIVELSGDYLAPYETVHIEVDLSPDERRAHDEARAIYRDYVSRMGIRMSRPEGWADFVMRSAQSDEGRRAMEAYRTQRHLALAAAAKLDYVAHLLHQHRHDRAIVFTQHNDAAYEVSRRFLIPAITHQTKIGERSRILEGLAQGTYTAVATSKVLNEGVDVPSVNVGIIMSGSGSVREHVQRLGRILRKQADKQALLYELVTTGTSETFTSERRRQHSAYR
ncbi:DEAD/DEAH box helicase family protein [Haliangium sp.]|uniref:DEAD/DEAH box helicase family protein n=1 Tax=Haliangium sp. TaxID=2663208 RepID=UPI003D132D53